MIIAVINDLLKLFSNEATANEATVNGLLQRDNHNRNLLLLWLSICNLLVVYCDNEMHQRVMVNHGES